MSLEDTTEASLRQRCKSFQQDIGCNLRCVVDLRRWTMRLMRKVSPRRIPADTCGLEDMGLAVVSLRQGTGGRQGTSQRSLHLLGELDYSSPADQLDKRAESPLPLRRAAALVRRYRRAQAA